MAGGDAFTPASRAEEALAALHARGGANYLVYTQADIDAAAPGGWPSWIREARPDAVLLCRPDHPVGVDVVEYCHRRGLPAVALLEQDLAGNIRLDDPAPQLFGMAAQARKACLQILAACDAVEAEDAALARCLQGLFPGQKVVARGAPVADDTAETRLGDAKALVDLACRVARRSRVQRAQGWLARAAHLASAVGRAAVYRIWGPVQRAGDVKKAPARVLFVANSFLPTLQICFTRPLEPLADRGAIAWEVLADIQLHKAGRLLSGGRAAWARRRIAAFNPTLIVFCRYSGAHAASITAWARARGVPMILHLDDDLLSVPRELGADKYAFHNRPERLAAVRHLLREADLVYCSTPPLLARMQAHGIRGRGLSAHIHCPGEVLREPPAVPTVTIGYMGIDHAHDFSVALPGLVRVLERNPHVRFEIFGPIAKPPELDRFGDRVGRVGFVRSYDGFLRKFASLDWAIGICPLADTPFNRTKANNKWVEYTSVGAAVVATADMLYDECCSEGCGMLAADDMQWESALQLLVDDAPLRRSMAQAAQRRLALEYSPAALCSQIESVFAQARDAAGTRAMASKDDEASTGNFTV